jgi:ribose transport system substrate-binding protein
MDYTRQNLDLVKSGQVYAIIAQPLYEEGAATADLAGALAEKKTVAFRNVLPAKVVTAADLEPYYRILEAAGQ